MIQYKKYIAICSGILLLLPVIANAERFMSFEQMYYLSISTDKRVYYAGGIATYTITFKDSQGRDVDPDLIRATYDSQFITLERISDGVYKHVTGKLTLRDHQLGVYAEKDGFFVQESSTVRPIITHKASDKVKATSVQQHDLLKFRLSNDLLSKGEIYKVSIIAIGAGVESIASPSWIQVPNHVGIDLKSVNGSIGPGEKQTIKLVVQGVASKVVW
ncbi:MAG: hypothetical protein ACE5J2_08805, partial [Nitrososphaerales archaeon]